METVLVTGSSRGIGKAIAREFGLAGYHVILNASKSLEELEKTKEELQKEGISCYAIVADVSNYGQCQKLFQEVKEKFGDISVLINNAGISHIGLFSDMVADEWKKIMAVNVDSVLHCTHLAIPSMVQKHSGIIINISSMWGERGASCEAVYSASKGAVNAFTKAMAKELGPSGIRVNAISCGVIQTQMNAWLTDEDEETLKNDISLMRFGNCEEVAKLALFLAQASSAYITGQIISVDGGIL